MTQPDVSHLARQTLHRTAPPGPTAPVWSSSVKHTENDSVFLIVLCDSELLSYEKSLWQELVQILSWVHFLQQENRNGPTKTGKTTDPTRLSRGGPYVSLPVGIRPSLLQRPVAKIWGQTDKWDSLSAASWQ